MIVAAKQQDSRHRVLHCLFLRLRITSLIALQLVFVSRAGISVTGTRASPDPMDVAVSRAQHENPKVVLVWMDASGHLSHGFERTAREVKSILAAAGIEIYWTKSVVSPHSSSERIRVIPVVPVPTDSSVWGFENNALGTVSGPASRPHVYVFLPNVLRALGCAPWESYRRIPAIAKVVGQVAAHEVFHVLWPDEPHARDGLMMKRWNVLHLSQRRLLIVRR